MQIATRINFSIHEGNGVYKEITMALQDEAQSDWQPAMDKLYMELHTYIQKKFGAAIEQAKQGKKAQGQPASQRAQAKWCDIHDCELQRQSNDKGSWYSHRQGNEWCKGEGTPSERNRKDRYPANYAA